MPAFVDPALVTTAKSPSTSDRSIVSRSAGPVSRPRSSLGTTRTSASITRAAERTDECAESQAAIDHRIGRPDRARLAACRPATSADRFPAVPPETKTPPADDGRPTRSAIQRSVSFSAHTAPAPSSQLPAYVDDALITRSNSTLAFVGAPGTKARKAGWSVEGGEGGRKSKRRNSSHSPTT